MSNKTSDKNVANDIKILKKFCEYEEAVVLTDNALEEVQDAMQNILAEREQDKKRIQELEEENKRKDMFVKMAKEVIENSILKQVVIDKVNEINKKYEDSKDENGESPYFYPDFTIRILQKLLEGEK